jgi:hypothetical protein
MSNRLRYRLLKHLAINKVPPSYIDRTVLMTLIMLAPFGDGLKISAYRLTDKVGLADIDPVLARLVGRSWLSEVPGGFEILIPPEVGATRTRTFKE